jgi:hypothetical protein
MAAISFDVAPCIRLANNEISLVHLAGRFHPNLSSCGQGLSGGGPFEGFGKGSVEVGDEGFDASLQVLFRGEAGSAQEFADENGKPDFDLVEPRGVLGREVKANTVARVA